MGHEKPTYEELEAKLAEAEKVIEAIRSGEVDAVVGKKNIYVLRLKELEKELREKELRFQRLMDGNIIGVIVAGMQGIFEANDVFLNMVGYTRKDLADGVIDWQKMTPPEYADRDEKGIKELQDKGFCSPIEKEYIRKDRTRIPILIGASLLSREPLRWICFVLDLTELKHAHDQLEQRVRDRTFQLVSANKALEQEVLQRQTAEDALRHLSRRLLEAQETERRNVALELHDGLGGSLVAIKMALEKRIDDVHKGKAASGSTTLEHTLDMVKKCMRDNRRIQRNLRPSVLDHLGLASAVRSLCDEFENNNGIRMTCTLEIDGVKVPEDLKIILYRVSQEALNNIAKHSGAKSVDLSLTHHHGLIQLTIKDNGRGFDVEGALSPEKIRQGIGLASMKERCELFGGSFSIHSSLDEGTTVQGTWRCDSL
jgi:PAS domain S-box-containing protein